MSKKIVAVSGYFDPIHIGHLEYLNEASQLGDELHVIVNNDYQASLKKGRSFMREDDRLEIVRSVKVVDKVSLSIDKDKSVKKTLIQIKPNIFANGGDQFQGSILEEEVCTKNNIQIIDGLGKKIRSSSKFTGIGKGKDSKTPPILTLIVPVFNEKTIY